jgi:hypothetical protein
MEKNKSFEELILMNKKEQFPSREDLDEAFHFLHEAITRISVDEEEEMVMKEDNGQVK